MKKSWQHQTHKRAALVHDQLRAAWSLVQSQMSEDEFFSSDNALLELLDKIYTEDFPLARLMDGADLIVHAEGPGVSDHEPRLNIVTWLCESVGRNLRALMLATAQLTSLSPNTIRRHYELRLAGIAPGSLYIGFAVSPPPAGGLLQAITDELDPAYEAARDAIRSLSVVPQFVSDTEVRGEIVERLPDPAVRDASLMAAYQLAPSGKRGINTLEISSTDSAGKRETGILDARDRIVLRETVRHRPVMRSAKSGTFEGEVREVDLDTQRFKLKTKDALIRCAFAMEVKQAKQFLGATVRVSGQYEASADGRPRLLRADEATVLTSSGGLFPAFEE